MSNFSPVELTDPEFVSGEWKNGFVVVNRKPESADPPANIPPENGTTARVLLQWVHDKEVVLLPKASIYKLVGKRMVDIIISTLVIVFVLSWMIPLVATLIICESPGPFFFIQGRSGRKGVTFPCLKFRTMYHKPNRNAFEQTLRNDTRVTPIGRFLRKTNLDEMPQFINVLLGDMSLVGPRPHAVLHDAMHWTSPAYRERYWVKPGITGLAQIRGARGATGHVQRMEHRVRYDHFYIPRQSFGLDMKICLMTLKLMFRGDVNAW